MHAERNIITYLTTNTALACKSYLVLYTILIVMTNPRLRLGHVVKVKLLTSGSKL